jgi:hypothetical protein
MTEESQQEVQLTDVEKRLSKQLKEENSKKDTQLRKQEAPPSEDEGKSSDSNIPSDTPESRQLDSVIKKVKLEFREWKLVKRRSLVIKLGQAYENVVSDSKDVCEEVKNTLRDEIADRLISARDIERYCPDKWKKNTKPKAGAKNENDNLSFSKKPQITVAKTEDGKSIIVNEITSNTKASDDINQHQLHDPSVRNVIAANDNNEAQSAMTNQRKSDELKANADKSTVDSSAALSIQKLPSYLSYKQIEQECTSCLELQDQVIQLKEAFQRISIPTADQIQAFGFEFIIPTEKYEMVKDAMDKSESAILIKCDWSKRFVRAVPDVDN